MATTAVIASTVSSDTYVFSVASGEVKQFGINSGNISGNEKVVVEQKDSSSGYSPLLYLDSGGNARPAQMTPSNSVVRVSGPIDCRLRKTATSNSVEVVEYT